MLLSKQSRHAVWQDFFSALVRTLVSEAGEFYYQECQLCSIEAIFMRVAPLNTQVNKHVAAITISCVFQELHENNISLLKFAHKVVHMCSLQLKYILWSPFLSGVIWHLHRVTCYHLQNSHWRAVTLSYKKKIPVYGFAGEMCSAVPQLTRPRALNTMRPGNYSLISASLLFTRAQGVIMSDCSGLPQLSAVHLQASPQKEGGGLAVPTHASVE